MQPDSAGAPRERSSLFISVAEAATLSHHEPEYILRLARTGILPSRRTENGWEIDEKALNQYVGELYPESHDVSEPVKEQVVHHAPPAPRESPGNPGDYTKDYTLPKKPTSPPVPQGPRAAVARKGSRSHFWWRLFFVLVLLVALGLSLVGYESTYNQEGITIGVPTIVVPEFSFKLPW